MLDSPIAPPPDMTNPTSVADWVEISMIFSGSERVGKSEIRSTLRTISAFEEDEVEVQSEMIVGEIKRRRKLAPLNYPFIGEDGGISLDKSTYAAPYVFLLLIATSPALRKEKRQAEVEKDFDDVALDALKKLVGPSSSGVRFGTPASGERPKGFVPAIKWLSQQMNLDLGVAVNLKPKRQDGGVDVVVWRPFLDGRSAYLTILAQCTVQVDWRGKAKDIVEDQWRGWIDFGKDPVTCLAIPFVVPMSFNKWDEVRRTVDILLDRMRIVELIGASPLPCENEIKKWMEKEIKTLNKAVRKRSVTRLTKSA